MSVFSSLLRRADTLRKLESDPIRAAWWVGYMRGLRRAHHGDRFGSGAEHQMWLDAASSQIPDRAAMGRGYAAGLTMTMRDPD